MLGRRAEPRESWRPGLSWCCDQKGHSGARPRGLVLGNLISWAPPQLCAWWSLKTELKSEQATMAWQAQHRAAREGKGKTVAAVSRVTIPEGEATGPGAPACAGPRWWGAPSLPLLPPHS